LKKKGGDSHDKDGDGWRVSKQKNQMENKLSRFFGFSPFFLFLILLLFFWGGFTYYVNRARIVRVSERGTRARKKNDRNSGPPLRAGLIDSRLF
jgi:hypothetical protein